VTTWHDTTPTDDDHAFAADILARAGTDPRDRAVVVADLLGWRIDCLKDAALETDARLISRGRAIWEAYGKETPT
jgi:hypothetical protein